MQKMKAPCSKEPMSWGGSILACWVKVVWFIVPVLSLSWVSVTESCQDRVTAIQSSTNLVKLHVVDRDIRYTIGPVRGCFDIEFPSQKYDLGEV